MVLTFSSLLVVCTKEHCRSENNAGALETSGLLQIEGNLSFNNCSTKFDGGCLFMNRKSRLLQGAGFMSFSACVSTSGTGGGVAIAQNGMVQLSGGKMVFNKCEAKQGGGFKMRRGRVLNNGGSIEMTDCHAKVLGGGASISSSEILFDGGSWNFHVMHVQLDRLVAVWRVLARRKRRFDLVR